MRMRAIASWVLVVAVFSFVLPSGASGHDWRTLAYRDPAGWLGQKTPWAISLRYKGPILIRGSRIDEAGPIRFAKGHGQHLLELRFAANVANSRDKSFRFLASATRFRTAGCYGFQIDGTSFSRVIVMQVVMALGP